MGATALRIVGGVWVYRLLAVLALLLGMVVLTGTPAFAACHHFSVTANPASVTEGGTVTVTVSRDGAVGPSQVDIATVDGTAKAGRDYMALQRTVTFTTETSQKFAVTTLDDHARSGARHFRLHLSHPGGCTVNPNYVVDPDGTVTVGDQGPAPTPSRSPSGPTTSVRTATAAPSQAPIHSVSPGLSPSGSAPGASSPSVSPTAVPTLSAAEPAPTSTVDASSRGTAAAGRTPRSRESSLQAGPSRSCAADAPVRSAAGDNRAKSRGARGRRTVRARPPLCSQHCQSCSD